jgi:hypothetical protein
MCLPGNALQLPKAQYVLAGQWSTKVSQRQNAPFLEHATSIVYFVARNSTDVLSSISYTLFTSHEAAAWLAYA